MTITTSRSDGDVMQGMAFGVLGVTIFGLTLPATRIAVAEFDPMFASGGRAVLGAIVGGLVLLYFRRPVPPRHLWGRLAIFALLGVFAFPVLIAFAMKSAPAAHGGVVLAVMPLLTAVASVFVAGERPSLGFWLCGIAGSATVLGYALLTGAGAGGLYRADLLLAAAAICSSLAYAFGGDLSRTLPGWEVICWALLMAAIPMLFVAFSGDGINWNASPRAWAGLVYTGVFSMLIGFFAWNRGLALGGIAKVGQVQLLQTFVTLAASYVLLGEHVGWLEVIFSVLVVAIVAIGARMRVGQVRIARA